MPKKPRLTPLTFEVGEFMPEASVQDLARYASDRHLYERSGTQVTLYLGNPLRRSAVVERAESFGWRLLNS